MKDLNVRQETIKILEEKTGNNLSDLSHSNFLIDMSPKAREIKAKKWTMGPHQDKKLLHSRETINKTKRQPMEWEKLFVKDILDKGLVSKIYKELTKLDTWKTNNPVKK